MSHTLPYQSRSFRPPSTVAACLLHIAVGLALMIPPATLFWHQLEPRTGTTWLISFELTTVMSCVFSLVQFEATRRHAHLMRPGSALPPLIMFSQILGALGRPIVSGALGLYRAMTQSAPGTRPDLFRG